jgi:hypothetical protein
MSASLLYFHHHKTIVGAESSAYTTVRADDWFLCILVEVYGAYRAGRYAFAASVAFFLIEQNTASGPQL